MANPAASPPATVVVPTRGRPQSLQACLRALAAQSLPVEVVVAADGDDQERTRAALAASPAPAAGLKLVHDPERRGAAAMRNLGAESAAGEIVCFTDDDCEPEPDWAEALAGSAAETGVAAGRTVPADPGNRWGCASQAIINALLEHSHDAASGRLGFAATSNLAMRREIAAELPFDEAFVAAGGEDREWSARAAGAGLAAVYVPAAVVRHRQLLDRRGFLRQQWNYGVGGQRFRATATPGRYQAPRLAGLSPSFQLRLVRLAAVHGPGVLARAELGQIAGLVGALRARARRRRR